MNDLTIIHYTANAINSVFAENVRRHLLSLFPDGVEIISVSQEPICFGDNICVGRIGRSAYNVYRQIFEGVKVAKTPWVACHEDDVLYSREHFEHRPDGISYNMNKWWIHQSGIFFYRPRINMLACVARRSVLLAVLAERFEKYPTADVFFNLSSMQQRALTEPGRYERHAGLTEIGHTRFRTDVPLISFSHDKNLGGRRHPREAEETATSLPHWGEASNLWQKIVNHPRVLNAG